MKVRGKQEGFTLIELLIVIVVIGVLAGIAIFAFEPFQSSSQAACEDANVRIGESAEAAGAGGAILGEAANTTGDFLVGGEDALVCDGVSDPVVGPTTLQSVTLIGPETDWGDGVSDDDSLLLKFNRDLGPDTDNQQVHFDPAPVTTTNGGTSVETVNCGSWNCTVSGDTLIVRPHVDLGGRFTWTDAKVSGVDNQDDTNGDPVEVPTAVDVL